MRAILVLFALAAAACAPLTEARAPRDPHCPPATCTAYPGDSPESPRERENQRIPQQ